MQATVKFWLPMGDRIILFSYSSRAFAQVLVIVLLQCEQTQSYTCREQSYH